MEKYDYNEGFLYKDSFSEKEFLKAVLKNINEDFDAPTYIFDEMEISDVKRINFPIILCDGKSEIEYSRQLGYERIETETITKTKTYGNGYQNKFHSTSSRTIIDWKNDFGKISGSASSGTILDEYKIYDEYITNHVMDKENIKKLSNEELKNYALSSSMIEYLENDILKKVYENNITYPTKEVKDEVYNGTTTLYNISCTIVSLYSLSITIRDKKINFIAASNGNIDIIKFGEYPSNDYDELFKFTKKVALERKKATKASRRNFKISLLLGLALFIIFLSLGIAFNALYMVIISIFMLILGLIIAIKFNIDTKTISKPYNKQIIDYNNRDLNNKKRNKDEAYQSFLRKNKLE